MTGIGKLFKGLDKFHCLKTKELIKGEIKMPATKKYL
jgi:hypothetical protein